MVLIFDVNLSTLGSNSKVMDSRFSALLPVGGERAPELYLLKAIPKGFLEVTAKVS